jgi:hypothetical protein
VWHDYFLLFLKFIACDKAIMDMDEYFFASRTLARLKKYLNTLSKVIIRHESGYP